MTTPQSTPFWSTLDPTITTTVTNALTTPELNSLPLDPSAPNTTKLETLKQALVQKLTSLDASDPETTYILWQSTNSALFHVTRAQGDNAQAEKILLELVDRPSPAGKKDLAALHNLSSLYEEKGDYVSAEKLARESLAAIKEHPALGVASPQALGSLRVLIGALGKQGKKDEAEEFVREAEEAVEGLGGGKFAVHQEVERRALEGLKGELRK